MRMKNRLKDLLNMNHIAQARWLSVLAGSLLQVVPLVIVSFLGGVFMVLLIWSFSGTAPGHVGAHGPRIIIKSMQARNNSLLNISTGPVQNRSIIYSMQKNRSSTLNISAAAAQQTKFQRSAMPLKELVKEGIQRGLIMIVNTSTEREAEDAVFAASGHRSSLTWDINGALDGTMGELLAEVMEEIHAVEDSHLDILASNCSKPADTRESNCRDEEKKAKMAAVSIDDQWPYKFQTYGQALHPLVVFSSYRFSHTEFFVIALVAVSLSEKNPSKEPVPNMCAWMQWLPEANYTPPYPLNLTSYSKRLAPIQLGSRSVIIANDPHGSAYDVAVMKCIFEDPAGANERGGYLYIKLQTDEFVPVFHEAPEEVNKIQFEGNFRYQFAYCSPPILGKLNAKYLKEWFMYHHFLFRVKRIHYFIYHGLDIDGESMKVLRPFLDRGYITLIDMRPEKSKLLGGQYPSHHLVINDCIHRVRFLADWVFFWGFEEYVTILPPHTLQSMLAAHKESPWISLGRMMWSNMYCSQLRNISHGKMWGIDRMFLRLEHPTCGERERAPTCYGVEGQRKWIANPRLVFAGSIHHVLDPQWSGITLDTGAARLNFYKGLTHPDSDNTSCKIIKVPEEIDAARAVDGWWWKDLSVGETTRRAHVFASMSSLFNSTYVNPSPDWPANLPHQEFKPHNLSRQENRSVHHRPELNQTLLHSLLHHQNASVNVNVINATTIL